MEKRRLQKTGGSSLSVTLPKKWTELVGLEDKSPVIMTAQKSGVLAVRPMPAEDNVYVSHLQIDGLAPTMIVRELISHYVSGTDVISIEASKSIDSRTRSAIRKRAQLLMGLEIVDETSKTVQLKNLSDIAKFSVSKTVESMFMMVDSMLESAMASVRHRDRRLARDVVNRDFEVDKLNLAISRQFRSLIRDRLTEEDVGMSRTALAFYRNVANQLERSADHGSKIAQVYQASKDAIPGPRRLAELRTAADAISLLLNGASRSVQDLDRMLAHRLLDRAKLAEDEFFAPRGRRNQSILGVIMEDSLNRMKGYLTNILEETIDYCVTKEDTASRWHVAAGR